MRTFKRNPFAIWMLLSAIGVALSTYSVISKRKPGKPREKLSSFAHFDEAWVVDDTVFLINGVDTIKRTIKR
ncbi:hypothetical protein [Parapedobacter indicus]|uniref:Uncharacterized protein n=1 Tax=Parapedobacter indicus TaxID=1477437 RepID=A0A1I3E3E7_9SPHI|nr:hypothetical protein [Parapedobacter indicus]PPL04951.1 hypothetical protein CLV26_101762 [Parapedobacter indicus]SFH93485.1 hypothetical protein SAMN05444682_101748 [Parapedobacter indicus]